MKKEIIIPELGTLIGHTIEKYRQSDKEHRTAMAEDVIEICLALSLGIGIPIDVIRDGLSAEIERRKARPVSADLDPI